MRMNDYNIKGVKSVFVPDIYKWQIIEVAFKNIIRNFSYKEIKLPILEQQNLFKKTLGLNSDIIKKEMFSFKDKNNQIIPSGSLTNPALTVYQTSNGNTIFANGVMSFASPAIGATRYTYNTAASLLASGEPYLVMASGTIDGATRTWGQLVGLDYL